MVKDILLITVIPEDGKANHVSTQKQADMWAKQIRETLPKINYRPNSNNQKGE